MSPRRVESGGGGGRIAVTVLLVLVVAAGLLLIVRAGPDTGPLDPRSGRDDGTRALVLLLEQQGADVEVVEEAPPPGADTRVLVLADTFDTAERDAVRSFVDAGGVAVVADPASPLHGAGAAGTDVVEEDVLPDVLDSAAVQANIARDECDIGALTHLRGVFVRRGVLFPSDGDAHCFGDGDHSFALRRDVGAGTIVALGDNRIFTNALIHFADNSGLAVALLAPRDGARVSILVGEPTQAPPEDVGAGEDTLAELIRPGVWMGLAQLGVAFVVLALAKGIRAGRVVDEPLPSPLAGSDAVAARATVMRRAQHHDHAGRLLRHDLHRDLRVRYQLGRDATFDDVDRVAAERDGIERGRVLALLECDPRDPAALASLVSGIAALRADLDRELVTASGGPTT